MEAAAKDGRLDELSEQLDEFARELPKVIDIVSKIVERQVS